ncbi:hypothetical protein [Mycobacterium asiaticum]|nr:hypothetical protein [Mycobacterium asiaticum]
MSKGDTPPTAAEMRSLAEQAEAEAAEAEALAAAARARARAIALRREAELVDAKKPGRQGASAKPADSVATEVRTARKVELEKKEPAAEAEATEPEVAEADNGSDAVEPESTATEPVSESYEPGRPRLAQLKRPKWSAVAAVLAVVVALVALGASVEMAVLHKKAVRERAQVAEYSAAARQGVVTLTSLDFQHAKQGVQNILEVSTGTFKDDFLKMADDFTNVVTESKVISQGSVQATAVDLDTMTDNSAVVLVASTSEVTNAAGAKQDPRKYRLIVTVTRDGGQLKMSKVEFVP